MMCHNGLLRLIACLAGLQLLTCPAWAYKFELKVPLTGCLGYFSATGSARHIRYLNEPNFKNHDEVIVEIKNVPLPPGTVLVVNFENEMIGKITLDKRRCGTLKLTSEDAGVVVPRMTVGTSVMLTKVDGSIVTW